MRRPRQGDRNGFAVRRSSRERLRRRGHPGEPDDGSSPALRGGWRGERAGGGETSARHVPCTSFPIRLRLGRSGRPPPPCFAWSPPPRGGGGSVHDLASALPPVRLSEAGREC